jgi:uncharacterized membrane protein YgcG
VRRDLVARSEYYTSPSWDTRGLDAAAWRVHLWQIDNAAQTFMAVRNGDASRKPQREPLEVIMRGNGGAVGSSFKMGGGGGGGGGSPAAYR